MGDRDVVVGTLAHKSHCLPLPDHLLLCVVASMTLKMRNRNPQRSASSPKFPKERGREAAVIQETLERALRKRKRPKPLLNLRISSLQRRKPSAMEMAGTISGEIAKHGAFPSESRG